MNFKNGSWYEFEYDRKYSKTWVLRNTSNMKLARESIIFMINELSADEADSSKYQKLQKKTTHITITYM